MPSKKNRRGKSNRRSPAALVALRSWFDAHRRQAIIAITAAGQQLLDSERRSRDLWLSQHLATLSVAERALLEQVVPLLDKMAEQ